MAGVVRVPPDLSKVENKMLFGLTKRQTGFGAIAIGLAFPAFFIVKPFVGLTIAVYMMLFIMAPLFFLAYLNIYGRRPEVYIKAYIQSYVFSPPVRPYQVHNTYQMLELAHDVHESIMFAELQKRKAKAQKHKMKRGRS